MKAHRLVSTLVLSVLAACCLVSRPAYAADAGDDTAAPGAPIHPSERTGWTVAIAGGSADLRTYPEDQAENLTTGNGIALDAGRAVNQRMLVLGHAELVNAGGGVTHSLYGVGVQYFVAQRVWTRAGIGMGNYKLKTEPDPVTGMGGGNIDRWSGGAFAGVGVEWLQFRNLALDTQIAWMAAPYPDSDRGDLSAMNVSLMIGVRWYGL